MDKVVFSNTVSLDGFVTGPNDDVTRLFEWYFSGDTEISIPGSPVLKVSPVSAARIEEEIRTVGAMVTGRRTFDIAGAWGGNPPSAPCFVVTHTVPQEWVKSGSPFTFVADGVEDAVRQAKRAAGDKDVLIMSANIMQQCLRAGVVDEILLDLVPILLGGGVRLFDNLGDKPIDLEITQVDEAVGVTHLKYRVVR